MTARGADIVVHRAATSRMPAISGQLRFKLDRGSPLVDCLGSWEREDGGSFTRRAYGSALLYTADDLLGFLHRGCDLDTLSYEGAIFSDDGRSCEGVMRIVIDPTRKFQRRLGGCEIQTSFKAADTTEWELGSPVRRVRESPPFSLARMFVVPSD